MPTSAKEIPAALKSEIELPFIGHITAGCAIETFPQARTLAVPASFVQTPDRTYILRAMGDNLVDEMIADGDLLLVEARQEANPGETVVAFLHQYETVIKRYHPDGNYVRLTGNTHHQQPIIIRQEELMIQGILVGLLRLYT